MSDQTPPPAKRGKLAVEESVQVIKEELVKKDSKQSEDVEQLEQKNTCGDSSRRESILEMRLANKEQEVQEYAAQISQIKKAHEDAALLSLRQANLDPGVNLLFGKMCEELKQTKDKLEQAQSELSAWKFTPDSQNGKKLISRCRTLIAENQELGRQLSQGKSAQLEAELALQKKYSEELKASQDELNEFVIQLDEEVEGMQSVIQSLQQQLAASKRESEKYKKIINQYEHEIGNRPNDHASETSRFNSQKLTKVFREAKHSVSDDRTENSDNENEYDAQNGDLETNKAGIKSKNVKTRLIDNDTEGAGSSTSADDISRAACCETDNQEQVEDVNDDSDSWSKEGEEEWEDRTQTQYSDQSSEEAVELEIENEEIDYDTPLEDDDHITAHISTVSDQDSYDQIGIFDNPAKKCTNNVIKNQKSVSKSRSSRDNEMHDFSNNASGKVTSRGSALPSETTKRTEQNAKSMQKSTREPLSQTAVVLA